MLPNVGPVQITVPRDRNGSFKPSPTRYWRARAKRQSRPLGPVCPVVFVRARATPGMTLRWKIAPNAFDITFDGRFSAARQ
ncbi:hypothetical protein AB0D47_37305 [Streptomyces sp. NPDC048376]|uniref:hypothetical protein n=1 Tax=unclassified Streptomyces TaxID=2593676 RepID=UPI0029B85D86|nr:MULTISPECIES: hypothetical protein [unclassified Streptomyces]MDX3371493.1 hypothetical protein [Streptomyces sp. ME02-6987-2C]MDX3427120.1 hypothetical protein [Streptomyces sp. ME02-6985-2c]